MRHYRQLKLLIFLVIASYFLIASGAPLLVGIAEIFPIFSWDLFSGVPPIDTYDYGLRVSKLNDETFDPPVYIDQIEHLIPEIRSDFNLSHPPRAARYLQVQKLGEAIISNNVEEIARQRSLFETLYLKDIKYIKYEIMARELNMIQYLEAGKVNQETILVVFEKGDKR